MSWPRKLRAKLNGWATARDASTQLGLDFAAAERLSREVDAIPVNLTIDRDGHVIAATLWRGEEEVST